MNKHIFVFNPTDNSGEHLILESNLIEDEENVFLNQKLTLNSYLCCSTMEFFHLFTPENLRKLADELESQMKGIKND